MMLSRLPAVSWLWSLLKSVFGLLSRLWCRRLKSSGVDACSREDEDDVEPILITITGENETKMDSMQHNMTKLTRSRDENKFVDWNAWQEDSFNNGVTPGCIEDNLFEDMEPKLTRPKTVRILKNTQMQILNPKENDRFQNRLNVDNKSMHIQTELGTWEDDQPGWSDDLIEEASISEEARNILKEKRRAEKQKRTDEQKRKKEEQRLLRMDKKTNHLGIKVN